MSVADVLLALGVPHYHSLFGGLMRWEDGTAAFRAAANGVHVPVFRAVLRRGMALAGLDDARSMRSEPVRVADLCGGAAIHNVAWDLERPGGWSYVFTLERSPSVREMYLAAWGDRCQSRYTSPAEIGGDTVHWLTYSPACQPFSNPNIDQAAARIAEELAGMRPVLEAAARVRPWVLCLEQSSLVQGAAADLRGISEWYRLALGGLSGYKWYNQICSPHTHAAQKITRRRLIVLGIREDVLTLELDVDT